MITPLQMAVGGAIYASTTSSRMVYARIMAVVVDLKRVQCAVACHFPIWDLLCNFPSCLVVFVSTSSAVFLFFLTCLLFSCICALRLVTLSSYITNSDQCHSLDLTYPYLHPVLTDSACRYSSHSSW
jgi:hypothetical protein